MFHSGGLPVSGDFQAGSLGRFLTLPVMLCNVRWNWTQLEHIPLHIFFPFGKHQHQRNHFFHSALQAWVSPTSSDWSWRPWPESRCPCCALTSWTIWAAAVSALWCTLRMELSMIRTLTSLLPSWGPCAAARTWAEKASKNQALFTCFGSIDNPVNHPLEGTRWQGDNFPNPRTLQMAQRPSHTGIPVLNRVSCVQMCYRNQIISRQLKSTCGVPELRFFFQEMTTRRFWKFS